MSTESQSRYVVHQYENGALLRIEPVKPGRDNTVYECLAENGVGDAVSAEATLTGYEGKWYCRYILASQFICIPVHKRIFYFSTKKNCIFETKIALYIIKLCFLIMVPYSNKNKKMDR